MNKEINQERIEKKMNNEFRQERNEKKLLKFFGFDKKLEDNKKDTTNEVLKAIVKCYNSNVSDKDIENFVNYVLLQNRTNKSKNSMISRIDSIRTNAIQQFNDYLELAQFITQ